MDSGIARRLGRYFRFRRKTPSIFIVGMPSWDVTRPFHALAVVAGVARSCGYDVRVFDLNIDFYHLVEKEEQKLWEESHNSLWFEETIPMEMWDKYSEWLHQELDLMFSDNIPELLAFSVNMSTRYFSIFAARHIKKRFPELPIMFGGVDCFPGEGNKEAFLLASEPFCDILCQGECEISFKKYLEEYKSTSDYRTGISGFAYVENQTIIDTGDVELPSLREKYALPAYDLFNLSKYTKEGALPFYFSRGCIYQCHFCSEKSNFRRYRCRKAEEAFEEIKSIYPYINTNSTRLNLIFADSIVNANMKELERLCELIIESGLKIEWGAQAHIHHLMTYDFLEKMRDSGLYLVFWGLETGSQRVVDLMNKQYSIAEAKRIIRDCSGLGISQYIPIILGFPGEQPSDVAETIDFILEFKDLPEVNFNAPSLVVVRPNSPLHNEYERFNLANNNHYDWYDREGTNTLPIRIARRYMASQAQGNDGLNENGLVDTVEFKRIDLDDPLVGKELYEILYELNVRYQTVRDFYHDIDSLENTFQKDFDPAQGREDHFKKIYLEKWHKLKKNPEKSRRKIDSLILDTLRRAKDHNRTG